MQLVLDKPAYKVREVAEVLGLSTWSVRALFDKEPGVLVIERPAALNKQRYRSLRIPRAVLERVMRRLAQ